MIHSDRRLYLVFEYLDLDLKKHMDMHPQLLRNPCLVKVFHVHKRWKSGSALFHPHDPLPAADVLAPDAERHCLLPHAQVDNFPAAVY